MSEKKVNNFSQVSCDDESTSTGFASKIAPAVALLLMGESISAQADEGQVPEPGTLALLAAGGAAVGTIKYIQKKRSK